MQQLSQRAKSNCRKDGLPGPSGGEVKDGNIHAQGRRRSEADPIRMGGK